MCFSDRMSAYSQVWKHVLTRLGWLSCKSLYSFCSCFSAAELQRVGSKISFKIANWIKIFCLLLDPGRVQWNATCYVTKCASTGTPDSLLYREMHTTFKSFVVLTRHNLGYHLKEKEMGTTCGTYEGEHKCTRCSIDHPYTIISGVLSSRSGRLVAAVCVLLQKRLWMEQNVQSVI
jgi:hypothetical protein